VTGEAAPLADILDAARALLRHDDPETAGLWPRASALLARRAFEATVLRLWDRQERDLQGSPMRVQLICLRSYLGNRELATRASLTWSGLSGACHHHYYELSPTALELEGWFAVVDELIAAVG
jgi:hypothetical protein